MPHRSRRAAGVVVVALFTPRSGGARSRRHGERHDALALVGYGCDPAMAPWELAVSPRPAVHRVRRPNPGSVRAPLERAPLGAARLRDLGGREDQRSSAAASSCADSRRAVARDARRARISSARPCINSSRNSRGLPSQCGRPHSMKMPHRNSETLCLVSLLGLSRVRFQVSGSGAGDNERQPACNEPKSCKKSGLQKRYRGISPKDRHL